MSWINLIGSLGFSLVNLSKLMEEGNPGEVFNTPGLLYHFSLEVKIIWFEV
jgi:hypothetical protein